MGNIVIFLIYGVFSLNTFFSTYWTSFFSFKQSLLLGSLGYILFLCFGAMTCSCSVERSYFYCSNFWIYLTNFVGACATGFSAPILWISQSRYITNICSPQNKGKYFSIFYAIVQTSQIWGSLSTELLLSYMNQFWFFCFMATLAVLSSVLMFFLPSVKKSSADLEAKPIKERVRDIVSFFKSKEMLRFTCYMMMSGIIMGFYSGYLFRIILLSLPPGSSKRYANEKTGYVLIILGSFELIGGIFNSKVFDKYDKFNLAQFSVIIAELSFVLFLISSYVENYIIICIAAALAGFSDCIIQSTVSSFLASEYGNKLEGFALYKLFNSIGAMAILILSISLHEYSPWIFILICIFFQCIVSVSIGGFVRNSKFKLTT